MEAINIYIKKLLLLTCIVTAASFGSEFSMDTRCFSSPNKKIKLEFRMYEDSDIGWVGGQVRYGQSKPFIPLVFYMTKTLQKPEGRPWEFQHQWLEIVNGRINGRYEFVSQGAIIYSVIYKNQKTGKEVDLSQVLPTDENGDCRW